MKKNILVLATAITLGLSGCMSIGAPLLAGTMGSQQSTDADKPKADKARVVKSAGIGCALGAVGAYMLGRKDDALAGCAAGAVVGGVASYRKQLKEFKAFEASAREAGFDATVSTRDVDTKEGTAEAFDGLVINYDPASMRQPTEKTRGTLDRLAKLLAASKDTVTVRFEGADSACAIPMAHLRRAGALDKHTVVDGCGKGKNRIVVTPVPDVG